MASIRERRKKDGTVRYLVQMRVKGHPPETARRYSHLSTQHVAGVVERMVNRFI